MSALTPEQLADIRERDSHVTDATMMSPPRWDRRVLLAEVERLRAGIEALAETWDEEYAAPQPSDRPRQHGFNSAAALCAREARALLNPTEGETDE